MYLNTKANPSCSYNKFPVSGLILSTPVILFVTFSCILHYFKSLFINLWKWYSEILYLTQWYTTPQKFLVILLVQNCIRMQRFLFFFTIPGIHCTHGIPGIPSLHGITGIPGIHDVHTIHSITGVRSVSGINLLLWGKWLITLSRSQDPGIVKWWV